MIGRRIASYEVQALLGKGGMGEVYRAHDTRLGRDVAIKILSTEFSADPDRVARFEREARVLASLNHPNIAMLFGLEEEGGLVALVLELVEGPTLADRIARGRLSPAEAMPIARQIAEAIEAAHERGIVHRDLKPANIKLTTSGIAKVLDFGLAKTAVHPEALTIAATRAGVIMGTAPYMSPEQARGAEVDKRSDIWAFGCVLFEMFAGVPAFQGASWLDTLTAIATREPDYGALPATTPAAVRQLIARCLEKDPQVRLRDIGEARIALGALSSGEASRIAPAAIRRVPRRAWIGGAVIAAVAALGWIGWRLLPAAPVGERLEYAIAPPEGVTWGELPEDPWPRISPDGRHLVFVGRSASGVRSLWIRDTSSNEAHALPDTQDLPKAAWPFWSADSKTVAYCIGAPPNARFKKIDLGGRPPETMPAKCGWSGGSWNARGQILYQSASGLFTVAAGGGPETRATTSTPGAGHWYPRWLPDGRRFLYAVVAGPDLGIFVGSIEGAPPKRVVPMASGFEYVETGGRAFVFGVAVSTLLVQQVDPASLARIGDAVPLANRIGMGLAKGPPLSVSSSLLVYRSGSAFGDSTLVWMDRQGRRLGRTYGANTPIADLALSHDEATIAFSRFNRDTNSLEVWTADAAHGTEQLLYAPTHLVSGPVFSPDDRTIVLADGLIPSTIKIGSAGPPRPLTTQGGVLTTDWSADGRTIFAGGGLTGVYAIPAQPGGAPVRLHEGVHPRLSPDGRWLAYTSTETGTPQIVVERYPEGAPKLRISTNGGFQPAWRGDSGEVFYLTSEGDVMAVRLRLGAAPKADEPVRLFRERFQADGANFVSADYAVTRDGQRFLVRLMSGEPKPLTAVRNWVQGLPR